MVSSRARAAAQDAFNATAGSGTAAVAFVLASGDGATLVFLLCGAGATVIAGWGAKSLVSLRKVKMDGIDEEMGNKLIEQLGGRNQIRSARVKRQGDRYLFEVTARKSFNWRGIPNNEASLLALAKFIELLGYGNAEDVLSTTQGLERGKTATFR